MSVEVDENQVARAKQAVGFEGWLANTLAHLADGERPEYGSRARDLFVQGLCALKLDLAIEAGLRQENCRIESSALTDELDQAMSAWTGRMQQQILAELDLADR